MSQDHRFGWTLAGVCCFGWALATTYTNHAPLIPVFMERLGISPTQAGLLSLAFFVAMAVVSLPSGLLSDRLGPKRIATAGLAIAGVCNVGLGYAQAFPILLGLKVLSGVGAGLAFIAGVRYVTIAFPPSRAHFAQGLYGGCIQLGAGSSIYFMPVFYARLDLSGAFLASAVLVAGGLAFWIIAAPDRRTILPAARFALAMRSGVVWLLTLAHTGTFGLAILVGTWITTFLVRDVGLSLSVAGGLGSAVLVVGVLSRPGGGIVMDWGWMRTATMIRSSLLVGAIGLGLLAWPGRPAWMALIALLIMGAALSLPYAALMNTAAASVPGSPGAAVGLVGAGSLILIAVGAPALGALYARTANFSLAFGLLGAFALLVFGLMRHIRHEKTAALPKERNKDASDK